MKQMLLGYSEVDFSKDGDRIIGTKIRGGEASIPAETGIRNKQVKTHCPYAVTSAEILPHPFTPLLSVFCILTRKPFTVNGKVLLLPGFPLWSASRSTHSRQTGRTESVPLRLFSCTRS